MSLNAYYSVNNGKLFRHEPRHVGNVFAFHEHGEVEPAAHKIKTFYFVEIVQIFRIRIEPF